MEVIREFIHPNFENIMPRRFFYSCFNELMQSELAKEFAASEKFYKFSIKSTSHEIFLIAEFEQGYYQRKVGICSSLLHLESIPKSSVHNPEKPAKVISRVNRTIWPVHSRYPNETTIRIYDSKEPNRIINDRSLIGSMHYNSFSLPPSEPFWLWERLNGSVCEFRIKSPYRNIGIQIVSVMDNDLSTLVVTEA